MPRCGREVETRRIPWKEGTSHYNVHNLPNLIPSGEGDAKDMMDEMGRGEVRSGNFRIGIGIGISGML